MVNWQTIPIGGCGGTLFGPSKVPFMHINFSSSSCKRDNVKRIVFRASSESVRLPSKRPDWTLSMLRFQTAVVEASAHLLRLGQDLVAGLSYDQVGLETSRTSDRLSNSCKGTLVCCSSSIDNCSIPTTHIPHITAGFSVLGIQQLPSLSRIPHWLGNLHSLILILEFCTFQLDAPIHFESNRSFDPNS